MIRGLPLYIVNAFTESTFGGNPAAVVPLAEWLPDQTLQAIASQHNLSETAYLVRQAEYWELRWFTPAKEVDLCGHATLASAHVLASELGAQGDMAFETRSGRLVVSRHDDGLLEMDFPAIALTPAAAESAVAAALGCEIVESAKPVANPWQHLYRVADEATLLALEPDFSALAAAADHGVIVTAPGDHHDFVSRFFIPSLGINEDPVTGSAHCLLTPYWSMKLGKTVLSARQCSARGGELRCELVGERVRLCGRALLYARGEILPAI